MKNLAKGLALAGVATTVGASPPFGIAPKNFKVMLSNGAKQTLTVRGPEHTSSNTPQRRGHWGILPNSNIYECSVAGANVCQYNVTHFVLNENLFIVNPDGTTSLVPHPPEERKPEPLPTSTKPLSTTPSPTNPPKENKPYAVPSSTPSSYPTQEPPNNDNKALQAALITSGVMTMIICGCIALEMRNRIPIAEIPMATITNERNVVAAQPDSLLGTIQEDLRITRNNVLPHRQPVYNAIPTPTSLPSYNGIRGVPLNPQNQQPQVSANLNSEGLASAPPGLPPSPPLSPPPSPPPLPLNDGQSSSRQPASNSGDLHLPSQLRGINLQGGIVQVDSSIGFVGSRHAPLQQPVSENPDHGAHQVSASSRTHSPSPTPSLLSSASSVEYHDIEPGPPPQYR